jgi:hypothetical protein
MNMLLSVLFGFLLLACSPLQGRLPQSGTIRQGIAGKVVVRTGNHMPGPGKIIPPPASPAAREILVYPLTNSFQVQTSGSFYTQIQTKLVAKIVSRPDGTVRLFLPPGKYSLFSQEKEGLFANRLDGENNIFPVEVKAGQLTAVEFIIDYHASY